MADRVENILGNVVLWHLAGDLGPGRWMEFTQEYAPYRTLLPATLVIFRVGIHRDQDFALNLALVHCTVHRFNKVIHF